MAGLAVGSEVAGCRIDAVAGEGGMGIVYVATQLRLNRRVALKVIAPDLASQANFRERFKSESLLAASIEHPNVIPVYEAGETDGLLYLVMRYVEGTDLRELLDYEGRLEPGRAAGLMAQVGAALSAAHRQGLVHRDVKPANVLVVTDPQDGHEHAYLTDFGIARETGATGGITRTGAVVGTTDYLAPERFEGERGDTRSDVYAFGCMLYEVLAGEVPFPRDSEVATMFAHANAPVPSLGESRPDVPAALVAVVRAVHGQGSRRALPRRGGDGPGHLGRGGERARAAGGGAGDAAAARSRRPRQRPAAPAQPPAPPPTPTPPQPVQVAPQPIESPPQPDPPPPQPPTTELPDPPPKKRPPVAAIAGLLVAVVAVVVLVLVLGGGGGGGEEEPGQTSASVSIPGGPDGLTVVGGKVWVASAEAGRLTPIDAGTRKAGRAVEVGSDPDSVTSLDGSLWVTNTGDGTVSRLDDASGAAEGDPIEVGDAPEGIAAGEGSIWVANSGDGTLTRLDASSGEPSDTTQLGGTPIGVAAGRESIWVTDTAAGTVRRVSASSGRPQGGPIEVGSEPRGVAVSSGDVWVANSGEGTVTRLDESTGEPKGEPIEVGNGPREVAAAGAGRSVGDPLGRGRGDPHRPERPGGRAQEGRRPAGGRGGGGDPRVGRPPSPTTGSRSSRASPTPGWEAAPRGARLHPLAA